ncbi:glucocorticoid modulatory element-binding protein 2 isoform X2 [Lissotriton helveticus]
MAGFLILDHESLVPYMDQSTSIGPCRSLLEESLESENAADGTAYSASTELKEAVLVKMEEEEETVEAELAYAITCGDSKANLIWSKFVCPGINVKCVQYNEHLISPKEFVHIAGKSTLKDWKRAIRMNGVMLRKIMDSGELDFYQHSKVCSNTCRSTKIDLSAARVSLSSQSSTEYIPITPVSNEVNGSPATITIETCEDSSEWAATAIADDTFNFWQGLRDAGLLEEVIQELHQELLETIKGIQLRLQDPPLQVQDAILLNNIVQNFGMLDLVKKVLAGHKSQMDRSREQYTRDLAVGSSFFTYCPIKMLMKSRTEAWTEILPALEQQCDEHRRRAKELKSKSQHLNNVLMTLTPVSMPTPVKRPRLSRATSGPAAMTSQFSNQSAQFTLAPGLPMSQLTNIPISKVMSGIPSSMLSKGCSQVNSPASQLMGGYTVLASSGSGFPNTLEIHPDSSNLTVLSTAAMQDGSTVVKVLSPYQLLNLAGLGTTIQNLSQITSGGNTIVAMPCNSMDGTTTVDEHTATFEVTTLTEEQEQK